MPSEERRPKDPAEKAQQALAAQLARDTAVDDLKWLMGDVRGRRFVHRRLEAAGIYRTTFSTDAIYMAFLEGNRNAGIVLMNELLQHCPKRLSEMQRENLKHERSSDSTGPGTSSSTG